MLDDQELDEAWRVLTMFAAGRFSYRLADFPARVQQTYDRLGPSRRRSHAELIDSIHALAAETEAFDAVSIGSFTHERQNYPLVKLVSTPSASAYAPNLPVCVVAGIHGDETDSILGALEFARHFARNADLRSTYALTVYPCLNPVGYERMTRENGNGLDLNREFFRASGEPEILLMERDLAAHRFLGMIATHSDYESFGIYAYAAGAILSERLAKPALFQASSVIPINVDPVIDGHPAQHGIINEKYPGALGPLTKGDVAPFDITVETPNLFALSKRAAAQAIACETILQEYRAVMAEAMYL